MLQITEEQLEEMLIMDQETSIDVFGNLLKKELLEGNLSAQDIDELNIKAKTHMKKLLKLAMSFASINRILNNRR